MAVPLLPDSTKDLLVAALQAQDAARPRSQQKDIGRSEVGGCRRRTFYRILGVDPVNITYQLPAWMGTFVHQGIEAAIRQADPEAQILHPEVRVPELPGLLSSGHSDLYRADMEKVIDWKSVKKSALRWFPKSYQIWQVQLYAYSLIRAGYPVSWVELVAIPRDGTEDDIRVHTEAYSEGKALEALAWLEDVYRHAADGVLPPADMKGKFCSEYCPFYGPELCQGG